MVSMWAAFGHAENIPPLAFALPAMFAKSSTIYNPFIYLMLRPNFRRLMWRDLGILCHTCLKGCHCYKDTEKCVSKPEIRIRVRTIQSNLFPLSNSSAQPAMIALNEHCCGKCEDAFECFRHYPQTCGVTKPDASEGSSKDQPIPEDSKCQRSMLVIVYSKRTSETDNTHINLEMTPGMQN